jgi:large repetitive protein
VFEDPGAQFVSGWATSITPGPAGESGQAVSFTVSSDNPGLFSVQPAVSPAGTLTYTPAGDANGVATVTVTARDDGGTANGGVDSSSPATFTLTVLPVNDAPTFNPGGDQLAVSLLGAQTVPGWASGLSAGPSDESSQSVSFTVSTDAPGLFVTQPAIAPDGTLTYTPRLLGLGVATVTVQAVDSGGTASGGVDSSPPVTFTITVV